MRIKHWRQGHSVVVPAAGRQSGRTFASALAPRFRGSDAARGPICDRRHALGRNHERSMQALKTGAFTSCVSAFTQLSLRGRESGHVGFTRGVADMQVHVWSGPQRGRQDPMRTWRVWSMPENSGDFLRGLRRVANFHRHLALVRALVKVV